MREYNFDGLVGPTHNYGGLSVGNVASMSHGGKESNPREAALQGLTKMKFIDSLGVGQAVLPPQPRPSLRNLRRLGFVGSDEEVIVRAGKEAEHLLRLCSSAAGDVDRERGDGRALGRHRGRARAPDPREPAADVSPRDRGARRPTRC